MNGKFLLDTNIVIAIFANDKSAMTPLADASEVFVPSVTMGELYYGAHKSDRFEFNISRIDEFASISSVLGCDLQTSRAYGKIKNALREKGWPIPENDIWIAAIAVQYNLTLVSRDDHFKRIDGLHTEIW
jgi:tRNA(fMet)-specific endonuclease VapC